MYHMWTLNKLSLTWASITHETMHNFNNEILTWNRWPKNFCPLIKVALIAKLVNHTLVFIFILYIENLFLCIFHIIIPIIQGKRKQWQMLFVTITQKSWGILRISPCSHFGAYNRSTCKFKSQKNVLVFFPGISGIKGVWITLSRASLHLISLTKARDRQRRQVHLPI